MDAGTRELVWDGTDASGASVASGVYVARMMHEGHATVRRMALVR